MTPVLFPMMFENTSLIAVRVEARCETGRVIETGTAFWFRAAADAPLYLVTNWHIVTGRSRLAPSMSLSAGVPTKLVARMHIQLGPDTINSKQIMQFEFPLNDPDGESPSWLEHPKWRHRADVVALRVEWSPGDARPAFACVGDKGVFDLTPGFVPRVTNDVFLLGYPWGLTGGTAALPIYKRGSIATEPGLPQFDLPRFLIDCRTARGMSGAPVIASAFAQGPIGPDGEGGQGTAQVFAGIYSGRLPKEEIGGETLDSASLRAEAEVAISEIGIVWRRDVLHDIVSAGVPGSKVSELLNL
ncbi:trypsin-like peptidase domain-containing protein [Bosea sp. 685]|uniref:trypsin-like peptidase domain-containing protein n=1 Tax=Bosea sp. 685 TaxID=3080057 RepID=UPI00289372CC|nr:trypsin-like peptidase domain-containing protein [Bosea sp. 685]WNJ89187.1 trypsin-like peptidase domain-containing protein [Bosea sp. 685]